MSRIPDTHAEAWDLLPWLANGRVAAGEREWLEAHVAGCADCRAELAAQRDLATRMSGDGANTPSAADEQKSFDKLWARVEAAESATVPTVAPARGDDVPRRPRAVRWLAAAVVVQAIGLGVFGFNALRGDAEYVTVADPETRTIQPAVRLVFAPQASMETVNTLLVHQGLTLVSGPGAQGNFTAVLSPDAVAAGASAESVARVMSQDPNVSFAQPIAR